MARSTVSAGPTADAIISTVPVPDGALELAITGVELSPAWADPPSAKVSLTPLTGGEPIEIVMSRVDGQFLNEALAAERPPRPRSHDLLLAAIRALGGDVTAAVLTERRGAGVYVAELLLRRPDGSEAVLDARPSDAINAALRAEHAALWALPAVLGPR